MNHSINRVLAAFTCLACIVSLSYAADGYTGFTVSEKAILPAQETHPSLWFNSDQIDEIRNRRNADDLAAQLWEEIKGSKYLTMDLPDIPERDAEKKPVHKYYGDMAQIAFYNGFMYQMETDAELKEAYRRRTIAALNRAYDGFIYEIDPNVKSTAVDEIYRGLWAQNYSAAYDFVQTTLTEEQDEYIRSLLIGEAEYIYENLFSWASRPHNHLSKPAWGLGSFALTFSEEPMAEAWLARAIKASNMNTALFFSGDGIYREGSHYYIFSFINFLPFLYHYNNVSGVDCFEEFKPAFEWPIIVRNGRGWMPNIEDSFIRPFPSHMVAGAYKNSPSMFHESASFGSTLQWNFQATDLGAFHASEERSGFNYSGASWDYSKPLVEYLSYDPSVEPVAPSISPTIFMDGGETVFRNDWSVGSPDHRHLLFQGVAEANNHQHYEHLSFIIQAEDQMMASDAGYTRKSYGESLRKTWYLTAEAHNVIMLNGSAPGDVEENITPVSRHRIDSSILDMEEKEAVYPGGEKHRRAILFPGENYFVVFDRVDAPNGGTMEHVFHGGRGSVEGEGPGFLWSYENDDYGVAAKLTSFITGKDLSYEEKMGEVTYIKGDFKEYPYIIAKTEANGPRSFLSIHFPSAIDAELPVITEGSDDAELSLTITHNTGTDTIIADRLSDSSSKASAAMSIVSANDVGRVHYFAVIEGTSLTHHGFTLFESDSPQTLVADWSQGGILAVSSSMDSDGGQVAISIPGETAEPTSVTVNNSPVDFEIQDRVLKLSVD